MPDSQHFAAKPGVQSRLGTLRPFVLLLLLGAIGCGKSGNEVTVHGHVTFRGSPLTHGSITFYPAAGRPVNAPLTEDGSYSTQLAPGEFAVTVSYSEPLPPGFKEGSPVPPPKIVLPDQYTNRTKTSLKTTVSSGQSDPVNFDLK